MKEQRRICLQRRYNIPPDRSDEGGSGSSQGQGDNGESGESSGSKRRKRPASAALVEAEGSRRRSERLKPQTTEYYTEGQGTFPFAVGESKKVGEAREEVSESPSLKGHQGAELR